MNQILAGISFRCPHYKIYLIGLNSIIKLKMATVTENRKFLNWRKLNYLKPESAQILTVKSLGAF